MPVCDLSIPADTEQVRVARLVACAAARRAGMTEDDVDEVRLAVGEAVGRAVVRHRRAECAEPVLMRMVDDPTAFRVEVQDRAAELVDDDFGMAMAVITGLVPDAQLGAGPQGGQVLQMAWVVQSVTDL